jgi:hypothetical protein
MSMQRILPGLLALSLLVLCGCSTARTFDVPYSEVEARLLKRLQVAPEELGRGYRTVKADPDLAGCLTVGSSRVDIYDYKAGRSLRLATEMHYDIGAIGGKYLKVKLSRSGDRRTRVSVNYIDKEVGFFLFPFAYVNPGLVREQKIVHCVIDPPPTTEEMDCRSLQGRSCGPENAELPCVSADRKALRCVCQGTWSCRAP